MDYDAALNLVVKNPTSEGLSFLCSQLESYEAYAENKTVKEKSKLKSMCIKTGRLLNDFECIRSDVNMLRVYQIMSKLSETMAGAPIYDKLESMGTFSGCLKFYLLWAESYAMQGNLQKFREIIELAKIRVKSTDNVADSFKDICKKYFPNDTSMYGEEEEEHTAMLFAVNPNKKKNRRRSSMAFIQANAGVKAVEKKPTSNSFGPTGGKTKIMFAMIDRDQDKYFGVSPEEVHAALIADKIDMDPMEIENDDDNMDITVDITNASMPVMRNDVSKEVYTLSSDSSNSNEDVKMKKKAFGMTVVSEESEIYDEKRRRISSPLTKTNESVFRKSLVEDKKDTQPISPYTGGSFIEQQYTKAAALFSDTVNFDRCNEEPTMPLVSTTEKFAVFVDETTVACPSPKVPQPVHLPPAPARQPLRNLPVVNDDFDMESPDIIEVKRDEKPKEKPKFLASLELSTIEKPKENFMGFDDEMTLAGLKNGVLKEAKCGIVTSTPAVVSARPPTHEDFFAMTPTIETDDTASDEDDGYAVKGSAFMRRRSTVMPLQKHIPSSYAPDGRPMSAVFGDLNLSDKDADKGGDDLNQTGIHRPVEAITAGTNPWATDLRRKIMDNCIKQKPLELHEYNSICPRIHKNKLLTLGGEEFKVMDLLGEGGYAKVFRCMNEDNQTMALKYEVPSCSWEVYICDQVQRRVDATFVKDSVMKITDAYIFSNASVLLNEFHGYGTLLDLSNKMKDPSWPIALLLSIHMATILRGIHSANIIHGDIKPDNFMVLGPVSADASPETLLSKSLIKLIDWGRAIDMKHLPGQTFTGRAGTEKFDCPEMMEGRPWTYQTDFYNYVSSLNVIYLGKYTDVVKSNGRYVPAELMKRRQPVREMMTAIYDKFLNVNSCDDLPSWDDAINKMTTFFLTHFSPSEWRTAANRFNQSLTRI